MYMHYMHMSIHIYYLLLHYHQALTLDNILFTFLFFGLFGGGTQVVLRGTNGHSW